MQKALIIAAIGATLSLTTLSASAQHNYVKDRPMAHEVKRPPRPDTHHVWIGTEWSWNNGSYTEVPGHWDVPPHGHRTWVAGHWAHESRGHYWVPGHWS